MGQQQGCVIVVAGGGPPRSGIVATLPPGATVVAADSGIDTALALGLEIEVALGDFDSVTPAGLAAARAAGARVVQHPEAKDATDLALALAEADVILAGSPGEIVVVGGDGGRLDHLLAGVLALADPAIARHAVTAHLAEATVHVVHGPGAVEVRAELGALLTILPVGGSAGGVSTTGLRYPLRAESLAPTTTRGVSNVLEAVPARVEVEVGTLLVVLPGEEPTHGGTP